MQKLIVLNEAPGHGEIDACFASAGGHVSAPTALAPKPSDIRDAIVVNLAQIFPGLQLARSPASADIAARRSDMTDPTLPSFRYRLEQQPPNTSCGGLVRGASVRQFPVSQGIGGASMRLQPGCLRELHWHTTAAELGYVVSGSCRTTVLSPDGAATDTFGPGDVWYFPSGWGHSIRRPGQASAISF